MMILCNKNIGYDLAIGYIWLDFVVHKESDVCCMLGSTSFDTIITFGEFILRIRFDWLLHVFHVLF